MRFNDHMLDKNFLKNEDKISPTIKEHQQVIDSKGYTWFGKVGKPINKTYVPYVKAKIENNEKVDVYFLKQSNNKFEVYKSHILDLTREDMRQTKEYKFIPEYYRDKEFAFGFWIKINSIEKLSTKILHKLIVCSSRSMVSDSLDSTAGTIYVEHKSASRFTQNFEKDFGQDFDQDFEF